MRELDLRSTVTVAMLALQDALYWDKRNNKKMAWASVGVAEKTLRDGVESAETSPPPREGVGSLP